MLTNHDNMGGFISAEFILQNELKYFAPVEINKCKIELQDGANWKMLDSKYEGISITINPSQNDAGLLYEISGSIILKKTSEYLNLLRLHKYILIKYTNTDFVEKIAGTDEYPLQITLSPLTPSDHSKYQGSELKFVGKQLVEPPILIK